MKYMKAYIHIYIYEIILYDIYIYMNISFHGNDRTSFGEEERENEIAERFPGGSN